MQNNYKILITRKAAQEIKYFNNFYKNISDDLCREFQLEADLARTRAQLHPEIYTKRYEDFRRINFRSYPIMYIFIFLKDESVVKIISCKHSKSNPKKFYK